MICNHFPTDPVKGEPKERSPWILDFDAVPFERFALHAVGGDGGAGFGMLFGLYEQKDLGVDMSIGFDELFFASQAHLFGLSSTSMPSRIWVGAARSWKWATLRASAAVEPKTDEVLYVPYLSAEARLPFQTSLGWEMSYQEEIWRNHVGVALAWTPFVIGFGMTEVQSWFAQKGQFGFFNEARPGSSTGLDNPGWWFSIAFDLPRIKPAPPQPQRGVLDGPVHLDTTDLARLEALVVERQVRADLAELAMRYSAEGIDPLESGALRRRILSGGATARSVLLKIALDTAVAQEERTQAISIAVTHPTESDLPALESLTEEPSPGLRVETALALRKLASPRAKALLERLRNDPDAMVRAAAQGE